MDDTEENQLQAQLLINGRELRAEMDNERFKGLLVINGGGAVALLTFFAAILNKEGTYTRPLVLAILWALLLMVAGLGSAIAHNYYLRRCSLATERGRGDATVCTIAWFLLWFSLACFMVAVMVVAVTGLVIFSAQPPAPISSSC